VPSAWSAPGVQERLSELIWALPPAAPPEIIYELLQADAYPELLGIDLFQISATVAFGEPPFQVLALLGEFDPQLVRAAFSERDYVVSADSSAGLLLCPAEGCDQGAVVDLGSQEPANPFGGAFGRRQPALAAAAHLISSPSDAALGSVARVIEGSGPSLASLAPVRALTELLAGSGHLLNLTVVNPGLLSVVDPLQLGWLEPDQAQERLQALAEVPLPPYSLAAYAAVVDSGFDRGLVLLVYANQQQAEQAVTALEARLNDLPLTPRGPSFAAVWTDYGELAAVRAEAAAGRWVVMVQLSAPAPASGRAAVPFTALLNELLRHETLWLLPGG